VPFGSIGAGVIAVAVLLFFIRRRSAARATASRTWPSTQGQVIAARVDVSSDSDRNDSYSADIHYSYRVAGQEHTASRVAWGGRVSSGSRAAADAAVIRYPVGSAVRVFYDPKEPGEAVLEPMATGGLNRLTFIMVIFLVVGAAFLAFEFVPS
jgi:hypothetical protein